MIERYGMTEAQARSLADEIDTEPGWMAWAEEEPFLNRGHRDWWVKAHHTAMPATPMHPYPVALIASRADWDAARARWE
jgi:hypothetical protein